MKKEYAQYLLQKTKQDYNRAAREFSSRRQTIWKEFRFLFDNYLSPGDKVLDLGCGNGRFFELCKDKDVDYYGVDISEKLIGLAKHKYPGGKFQTADALNLPFPNNFFNKVYLIAVLHNIPSREFRQQALKEARRVLRGQDSNQHQFSGANSGNLQGARSEAMPQSIVSDEQRRRLPEFARSKGSQKMDDFCVAPPRSANSALLRRRALKSSHFLASKADAGSSPAPFKPGGLLIATCWNLWSYGPKRKMIYKFALRKILGQSKLDFKDILIPFAGIEKCYFHCFTKKELEKSVKKENFGLQKSGEIIVSQETRPNSNFYIVAEKRQAIA